MFNNPLPESIPAMLDKLDKQSVAEAERELDALTDALASDLANPDAPKDRNHAIMDIACHAYTKLSPELLAAMLTVAMFRTVEARETVR